MDFNKLFPVGEYCELWDMWCEYVGELPTSAEHESGFSCNGLCENCEHKQEE